MARVSRSAVSDNSPNNKMAENIAVALEAGDIDFLFAVLDSEAIWNDVDGSVVAAEGILDHVSALNKPDSLTIDRVMPRGKVGAING